MSDQSARQAPAKTYYYANNAVARGNSPSKPPALSVGVSDPDTQLILPWFLTDLINAVNDPWSVTVTPENFSVVFNKVRPLNPDGTAPEDALLDRTRLIVPRNAVEVHVERVQGQALESAHSS
ncbi:MAG TPA: hypothetical protein VJS30_00220 [Paraburkholderia sp.]|nr:hypothetical protein [Paraburkholderia sp.]